MVKRILQIILSMLALVPLITGIWGIIPPGVADKYYDISVNANNAGNVLLDSNYRFYSGIWLGLGIVMFFIIPSIEKQKVPLRIICLLIFLGGIGRVVSAISFGVPPVLFVVFTVIELLFPLLIIMQNKVSEA